MLLWLVAKFVSVGVWLSASRMSISDVIASIE